MTGRLLGSTTCLSHKDGGIPLNALPLGHNKQACQLVLHTIPFVLSANQGSCEYHFKSFDMTQLQKMNPRSNNCAADIITTKQSHCLKFFVKMLVKLGEHLSESIFEKSFDTIWTASLLCQFHSYSKLCIASRFMGRRFPGNLEFIPWL